jgi:phage gp29-like protein
VGFLSRLFGRGEPLASATETVTPPPSTEELIFSAPVTLWRNYPVDGISPRKLRRIMRDADQGVVFEWMELLDDVATDSHVSSCLRTRKLAVAGAKWSVEPAELPEDAPEETKALAKKVADDASAFMKRIPHLRQLLLDLMDAHFRGFACSQPLWNPVTIDGRPRYDVTRHVAIESRFFRFDTATLEPLIMTAARPDGEPLPTGIIFHTVRDKPGIVVRGGTARSIVKPWLYKGLNLIDCASYLERFGHPLVVTKYKPNIREGSTEYEAAKRAARALIADMCAMIPDGTDIQLLSDLTKADNIDRVYLAFMRFCDEQISKAELGGAQAIDAGPGGLGHGQEQKGQGEVRQDIRELDACQLEERIDCDLLRPFVAYHYGADLLHLAPHFCLDVSLPADAVKEATAQKTRADTLAVLQKMGKKITAEQVEREFELDEVEGEDEILAAPTPPPAPTPGRNPPGTPPNADPADDAPDGANLTGADGAAGGQDYVDRLRASARARAADTLSPDLAAVLAEIAAASDADDLRSRLVARFGAMDPTALADVVRKSRILAELSGRLAVLQDA